MFTFWPTPEKGERGTGNQPVFVTYHSSGFGYVVCLSELSGSYSKATPAVGFHLACSLPNPFNQPTT